MPRTRVYEDNAARQRAYRKRKKDKKLDAQGLPLDAEVGKVAHETTTERAGRMGQNALDQFFGRKP